MLSVITLTVAVPSVFILGFNMLVTFMLSAAMLGINMLSIIMLSIIMLSDVMFSVIMLSDVIFSVIMLSDVMFSVIIAECFYANYYEYHRYIEYHYAERFMLSVFLPSGAMQILVILSVILLNIVAP